MLSRRFLISVTIFVISVIIITHLIVGYFIDNLFDKQKDSTELVGEQVILKSDTLLILRYNVWTDVYTLENSIEVNRKFVVKNLIDE